MKRFALLVLICISSLTSCGIDDDTYSEFYFEIVPIDSVDMPESFTLGEIYQIDITYTRPNSCYYFNDFIYEIDEEQRTVAVVNTVYSEENSSCDASTAPEEVTVHFDFKALNPETYVFKFYQGEDAEGVDQYYIVEVPVVIERPVSETPLVN